MVATALDGWVFASAPEILGRALQLIFPGGDIALQFPKTRRKPGVCSYCLLTQ